MKVLRFLFFVTIIVALFCASCKTPVNRPAPVTPILVNVLKTGATPVAVSATTAMDEFFAVSGGEVNTGIFVSAGTSLNINSSGLVDFGGAVLGLGAPILNADGDNFPTPSTYPAPNLRKNSLICRVGSSLVQGGTSATITPTTSGVLTLLANDENISDNSRNWIVNISAPTGPLTRFEILPGSGLFIDVDAPYNPSDIEVGINDAALVRMPSGTTSSPANDPTGWFTVDITTTASGPARWRIFVRPPDGLRSGPGFETEITHVNGNAKSLPLRVRITRQLSRGTIPISLTLFQGASTPEERDPATGRVTKQATHVTDASASVTLADPMGAGSTSHGLVGNVTVAFTPVPGGLMGGTLGVTHTERTNAVGKLSDNSIIGLEIAGPWGFFVSGFPEQGGTVSRGNVVGTIDWVSQP